MLRRENIELMEEMSELRDQVGSGGVEPAVDQALLERLETLETELGEARKKRDELEEETVEVAEAAAVLEGELSEARGEIASLGDQVSGATETAAALELELTEARGQIDDLVQAFEQAEAESQKGARGSEVFAAVGCAQSGQQCLRAGRRDLPGSQ